MMTNWIKNYSPGLLYVLLPASAAAFLGHLLPVIGGPVFGILLGIVLGATLGKPQPTVRGTLFASKYVLQWAVILMGCGISLGQVWKTGFDSLYVMLFTLLAAFVSAFVFAKRLGIPWRLNSLIGVGTAICGGSAIAAISPIIEAEDQEIAYAISTIFMFNIAAVFLFPAIGHLLQLSDHAFGLWAGTAINDTSSVVAAGYSYSHSAGDYATIVKLTRTTFIIPISLAFALLVGIRKKNRAESGAAQVSLQRIFPWFIVWFIAAATLHSTGMLNAATVGLALAAGHFMIIMALSAIGLQANFRQMMKTGFKPLLLGLIIWCAVAVTGLAVQWLSGQL